jgi:hypothetical protein
LAVTMLSQHHISHVRQLTAVIVLLHGIFLLAPVGLAAQSSESVQRQTIISLYKTRQAVVDRLGEEAPLRPGSIRPEDEAWLFIAYLDGRIHHYCRQRYLSLGEAGLEGLPCPLDSAGKFATDRFASVPEKAGLTHREKVAHLDRELNESLGRFDDMLLEEEEKIAAHVPRQAEDGGPPFTGRKQDSTVGRTGAEGAVNSEAAGRPGQEKGTAGTVSDKPEGSVSGKTEQRSAPPTAGRRDLEEGDDDIVARQLREAAEQETDPEVKERLWEEYRKYKEGIR